MREKENERKGEEEEGGGREGVREKRYILEGRGGRGEEEK